VPALTPTFEPRDETLARVRRRAVALRRRRNVGRSLAACLALGGIAAAVWAVYPGAASARRTINVATAPQLPTTPPPPQTFPLPSSGWRPGQPSTLALVGGIFTAALRDGQACAWIGDRQQSYLWPAGYSVRFNPTELVDAEGQVVASEGQYVSASGGYGTQPVASPCSTTGQTPYYLNSEVAVRSPAP
jgi:hypothetical protein